LIFDPSMAGTAAASLSVATVPEPGTLLLLSVAVCGAAVYQRIRSRRKKL
jgi:hypothetical protein